jgi:hypothetical protein
VRRLELGSPPAGAPPELPPSLNLFAAASPLSVSPPDASSRGEQGFPACFSLPCMFKPPHGLAFQANPPPSGADRHGCLRHPPDPLGLLACSPATRRAHARAKWRPRQQYRVRRRIPGEAPPRRPCLRRRRRRPRLRTFWVVRSAMDGLGRVPLRV